MKQTDLSKAQARHRRAEMSAAERALWDALRNRRFLGLKVRRQVPIGPYIADFYCAEHRLIIEAGGYDQSPAHDVARDAWLAAQGFCVLRLWSREVLTNFPGCLDSIAAKVPQH